MPKRDEIGREREKKNLDPNFIPTQPGLEISKKNRKKIQKIKKLNSGIISIQNGLREVEKERKKFWSRILFLLAEQENFEKNSKKLKNHFSALFLVKTG